ncbi:hypothetical protein CR513_28482, partial [Mucuna pruriens]
LGDKKVGPDRRERKGLARLIEEARKRQEEVDKRREEEIRKVEEEIVVDPFDNSQDLCVHLQAFQTYVYISGGDDFLSCKLFPGTSKEVAMRWFSSLPPRSIGSFSDLAATFEFQFAANRAKQLEVADLSDIKQTKSETLKQYLARFNATTIQGLRIGPFSDSLALFRLVSMMEIRAQAEKHVEAKEDKEDRLQVEKEILSVEKKITLKA